MCGIAGYLRTTADCNLGTRVSAAIAHRGPEDEGIWTGRADDRTLTLIHRRLRILDVSEAGHQPMLRGSNVIVFNGEIYNFLELRRDLEQSGYAFCSNSDTEVILAAYSTWGLDCIPRLDGMFAFAIWDALQQQLILARDRIGEKPLFYSRNGRSFIFGSEIKAILAALARTPDINIQALDDYLTYLYIPYPRTIFENIEQLAPASWMRIEIRPDALKSDIFRYWNPIGARPARPACVDDLRVELHSLLRKSVTSRLLSDVPIGVLLSGGIDSSAITAMMAESAPRAVRSFSVGFPAHKTYDEVPFAQMVAEHFGARHEVMNAEPSCSRHLARMVWHFDQPFGNPTAVLTYVLSELTKRSVTVALAGDGGDELFAGYPRYIGAHLSGLPRSLPPMIRKQLLPWIATKLSEGCKTGHQLRRIREFLEYSGLPVIEMYRRWVGYFSDADRASLYTQRALVDLDGYDSGNFLRQLFLESDGLEPLNRLAYVDIKSFLPCNVLEYGDRMSMAHALELRTPFTDHRLVEFSLRLPFSLKFRHGQSKWILRQMLQPLLPGPVLKKRKLGFNPPVRAWLSGELRNLQHEFLSRERLRNRGLFRTQAVREMLDRHARNYRDHSLQIWALIVLEIWFCLYVDGLSCESLQEDIDRLVGIGPAPRFQRLSA